ncbi:acyltransferase family protein [Chitinophaga arvensicola]|uniref:Acyltransferase family protein n=1 Tax=Chitinophaga arvensicola TaxID=29529 RepID=A0A1I0S5R6_9BACT|nr:acyltransferase family protein [Chitinophaga arvensicola]SEW50329.1 Acyltransferase family protein [Chitinophaga arvensicola]
MPSENTSASSSSRIYGLDALRAIAMLLGIVLHAAIAYKISPEPGWPVDNAYHSWILEGVYEFIHSFRMPLFYVVAGFFARMLCLKIGEPAFIRHRFKRIGVPFIFSLVFILPLSMFPFLYYRIFILESHTVSAAWTLLFHQLLRWNGMAHLWFLYYLLFYYAFMMVLMRIPLPAKFRVNFGSFWQVLLTALLIALVQVLFFETPSIGVYTGIIPHPVIFGFYGLFFLAGFQLHRHAGTLDDIRKQTWWYLGTGFMLTAAVYYCVWVNPGNMSTRPYGLQVQQTLTAFQTVFLVFGAMGFFLSYLNRQNHTLKYISDASYWMYLFHMCWIAGLQILFLHSGIPGWARFWLVLILTNAITLLTYQWFVRYTFIGKMLHGVRERPGKKTDKITAGALL